MSGISVSAPGTLMICGEHAVVYGHPAIVCAVEQRLYLNLVPQARAKITIRSALADYETDLYLPVVHPKLKFVFAALAQNPPRQGICLDIRSEIDPHLGLGSSAAVSVAVLAALARLNGTDDSVQQLHRQAMQVMLSVQKRGSGADLAAAVSGTMLAYRNTPQVRFNPLPCPPACLSLRYAGYKTPTAEVLALLAKRAEAAPDVYRRLYETMGNTAQEAIVAAQSRDWAAFYHALNQYQQHLAALGVCDTVQEAHLRAARENAKACKISGSGLGDCIIAFADLLPANHTAVSIAQSGILYE